LRGLHLPVVGTGATVHHHVPGDLPLELVGRALRHDHAVIDDRDAVAERVGLLHVVRGEEDRGALAAQSADLVPHAGPALRVEPGGGLVEEEHLRFVDDAHRDVHPPPLATRVCLAGTVGEVGEREGFQGGPGPADRLALADVVHPRVQDQLLPRAGVVPRATTLRDVADQLAHLRRIGEKVDTRDGRPSRVRWEQRGQHPQGGRLAGPVGAEEAEDLALVDLEVNASYGVDDSRPAAATGAEGLLQLPCECTTAVGIRVVPEEWVIATGSSGWWR
jgi:hypothetical protein